MPMVRMKLPEVRRRRRLTQRQLAASAGVRPDTISALERGKSGGIQFETLARLCDVLNCEPGDLLEIQHDAHIVPVLGGPDEDAIIRQRLEEPPPRVDGPSFIAELMKGSEAQQPAAGHQR